MTADITLAARQVRYEQRAFWRNRAAAFFTFLLPLIFLLVFATLNRDSLHEGVAFNVFLVPGLLAYGVVMATFTNLALGLTRARESGELKRMRGTPMPSWAFLGGRVVSSVVVAILLAAVTVGLAAAVWNVHVRPEAIPGLLLALAIGTACFASLGIAMLRVIPNADAGSVMVNVIILPLTFISGVWGPPDDTPDWLRRVADFFPLSHLANALRLPFDPRAHGLGIAGADIRALAVWAVLGGFLMVRALRAEMRRD